MSAEQPIVSIDIQGYPCLGSFIPKELAIYDGVRFCSVLFKPPYCKQLLKEEDLKIVAYLESQYHGLLWDTGFIDLNEFQNVLLDMLKLYTNPKILIKGDLKYNLIKKFVDPISIIKIPLKSDPKLSKFKKQPKCCNHRSFGVWHCALNNAKLVHNFRYYFLNDSTNTESPITS